MGVQVPSPALEKLAGLAQLVEHLICNQRVACSSHVAGIKCERSSVVEHHLAKVGVAGSNPVVRLLEAGVAELADAQDLKSCERKLSYRFDPGPRHNIIMSTLSSTG